MSDMSVIESAKNFLPLSVNWDDERMKLAKQAAKQNVLAWVNYIRAELRMLPLTTLPSGTPGHPHGCVIAKCFVNAGRTAGTLTQRTKLSDLPLAIEHPEHVQQFIHSFDAGWYPELVERAA